ncbi:hypothetical protein BSKO_13213 [Bryopsis sp. KO-2023]|nr:hypothetical protein BSKO_13213 [Bryopsis sp. KO-2023]
MDEDAKRKKREQAEARRRRILERSGARLSAITGETESAAQGEDTSPPLPAPETSRAPMSDTPPPTETPSNPSPPASFQQSRPSQPRNESSPVRHESPSPSPEVLMKSKLKNLVIGSPNAGGREGGLAIPAAASFRAVGLVFDFTRVFQILTAVILGIAAAVGVDYGMSPLLGLLMAEAMVIGGGWCVMAMNPYYMEDLVRRRRALNQIAMKEGGGIIPSVFYSIPTLREILTTASDLGGVAKGISEDVSIFVVVAGVVAEFHGVG